MEYNGREWMMKKIILIFSVVIIGVGLCGFRPRVQKLTPNNNISTPFPQTGVIKVYKYNMFKKEEIGELKWLATTERKYNSQKNDYYTEINITVENKTNEFVSFSFDLTGVQNKSVSGEVSPHGTWKSGARLCSGDCTGVEPLKKEITIS